MTTDDFPTAASPDKRVEYVSVILSLAGLIFGVT
jgi:hypothetical protein